MTTNSFRKPLSRRSILKTLTGGLGAAAMGSPLFGRSLSSGPGRGSSRGLGDTSSPASIDWTVPVPKGKSLGAGRGAFLEGKIVYCSGTLLGGPVVAHDTQRGDTLCVTTNGITPGTSSVHILNGTVYVGGLNLSRIDIASQSATGISRYFGVSDLAVAGENLIFATTGKVVSYNPATNVTNWSYSTTSANEVLPAPIPSNLGLVVLLQDSMVLLDPGSGEKLAGPFPANASTFPGVVAGGYLFYVDSSESNVIAVDLATGQQAWAWNHSGLSGYMEADCGNLYVTDNNGNLYALLIGAGQNGQAELAFPGIAIGAAGSSDGVILSGAIYIEDGVAYVGFDKVYAVDLPSHGQKVVACATPDKSTPSLLGVQNGVCYFTYTKGENLAAADLGNQIHAFFCESQLSADNYAASSGGARPSVSSYDTHIQLVDPSFCPRANKSVKLTVSINATVVVEGQTYNLTPTSAVWLTTDGAGEVTVQVQATDLSCPSLTLWGNFMEQDEAIVIYPDRDMIDQLGTVDSGALTKATTFDGSLMLQGDGAGVQAIWRARSPRPWEPRRPWACRQERRNTLLIRHPRRI